MMPATFELRHLSQLIFRHAHSPVEIIVEDDLYDARRRRFSVRTALALIIVLALNFWAARPGSNRIHGLGHWLGALILQALLLWSLWRGHITIGQIGIELTGWVFLVYHGMASQRSRGHWWEHKLADWMNRLEVGLRGTSWAFDRWYIHEVHVQIIRLAEMIIVSLAGACLLAGVVSAVGCRRRRPTVIDVGINSA
jgi:hypothetical protein